MKPERTGGSGSRDRRLGVLTVVVLFALVAWLGVPTSTYTTASVGRPANVDVVVGAEGALGLNTTDSVATGGEQWLFTLTNQLGGSANVTVSIAVDSQDVGDLVIDGIHHGESVSFSLSAGDSKVVNVDVECNADFVGQSFDYVVHGSTTGLNGTVFRAPTVAAGCTGEGVVFVDKVEHNTSTIDVLDGKETAHIYEKVTELGPARSNLDADSALEIPYVHEQRIKAIGFGENLVDTLDSSGAVNAEPIGVGDYDEDGLAEVYYNRDGALLAVRADEPPVTVANSGSFSTDLQAVAGVADFDGDGNPEVVFSNNNNAVGYVDDDGTVLTAGYQNLGSTQSIGRPADFDGDGTVRVPVVTGRGYVALVSANGTGTVLNSNYSSVASDSLAAHDVDRDGDLEVVFADTSAELHYMELDGSHAKVRNANGNVVSANTNKGAA